MHPHPSHLFDHYDRWTVGALFFAATAPATVTYNTECDRTYPDEHSDRQRNCFSISHNEQETDFEWLQLKKKYTHEHD
ncbi:hypothetical protein TNCV_4528061 [Trichonephila clavipes]|nr:hypothetical protein TNCV_4528061 [Trichonephila clavipes]